MIKKDFLVYIADDHQIVAEGITNLISNSEFVSEVKYFKNGQELFNECTIRIPNIVFLDIEMPVWDGRKTLVEINQHFPEVRCLMLSMNNEKYIIEDCIQKGAKGFLDKNCTKEEIAKALLSEDELYFSIDTLKVLSTPSKIDKNIELEPLSDREKEILRYLSDGMSPKEIADKIFLSVRTVETHKNNIMQKFQVNSVGKLISLVLKNKLV